MAGGETQVHHHRTKPLPLVVPFSILGKADIPESLHCKCDPSCSWEDRSLSWDLTVIAEMSSGCCPWEQPWLLVPIAISSSGVNLLVGTENGLMLLDRSGQGKVYNLINRRRFQQMDVLEGLNVLVTISGMSLMLPPHHSPSWLYAMSSSSSDKTCPPIPVGSSQGSLRWFIPE